MGSNLSVLQSSSNAFAGSVVVNGGTLAVNGAGGILGSGVTTTRLLPACLQ